MSLTKRQLKEIIKSSEKASQRYQSEEAAKNYQAIIATIIVVALLSLFIFAK